MEKFEGFIGVDFWTALFVLLNTLAIFLVARKLLFKPVHKLISERQAEIDGMYTKAEQLQKDAQGLKDELSARLESAQSESDRIVREALTRAENTERDIVAKARKEAASILDKAEEDARREKRQAMNDARDEVASLAVALAEQALEKQLDDEGRSRLMDDCIERLGKTDA